jgi:hypothetical protein
MALRHAAALALVGWYLVVPPPTHSAGLDSADRRAYPSEGREIVQGKAGYFLG